MPKGFILTDVEGLSLSAEECDIIEHPAVLGILLFARNYETPQQLYTLVNSIRALKPVIYIAVDQEGGRVQRFFKEQTSLKSMGYWGALYDKAPQSALEGLKEQISTMIAELKSCHVFSSLIPVLDIDYAVSEVIGDRSFHRDPEVVSLLAEVVITVMRIHGMPSIGKHFPGHGAVSVDSHQDLPIDNRDWDTLWQQDMKPYRDLMSNLDGIMPAHIVYPAVDPRYSACFSPRWLRNILRDQLNFQGMVISDDLTMCGAAYVGCHTQRVGMALEAGCDVTTLCNHHEALFEVLDCFREYVPLLSNDHERRIQPFLNLRS